MSIFGILLVVLLICALIGTENILKFLVIGIFVFIIGYFILKEIGDGHTHEKEKEKKVIQNRYYNRTRHHSQSYSERPIVTGDYFKSSWQTQQVSESDWQYCQYANSTTCANCARRKEHKKDDLYYYGVSDKCKEL